LDIIKLRESFIIIIKLSEFLHANYCDDIEMDYNKSTCRDIVKSEEHYHIYLHRTVINFSSK